MTERLTVVTGDSTDPYKNLALENWLLDHVAADEVILYLWQNQHTVVIGKNQNAWKECNISTLEADGGRLARRLSGGGAVYHDLGNLNFTFVAQKDHYDVVKQHDVILKALLSLGIQAEKSGRNDILVDGRKVSGNAFYEHMGRCYHHGTLLMQVDGEKMARYLNVAKDKLASKGVASVKSRVLNLVEVLPTLDADTLKAALVQAFAEVYGGTLENLPLAAVDSDEWQTLEARYSAWDWNFGRRFRFDRAIGERFPWGRVDIQMQIDRGHISDVQVYSDALLPDFIDALGPALLGARYERQSIVARVESVPVESAAAETPKQELAAWLGTLDY